MGTEQPSSRLQRRLWDDMYNWLKVFGGKRS